MGTNSKSVNFKDLYVLGSILPKDKKAIAVVGSRKMTFRGRRLTQKFVKLLVRSGFTIVSGLARGIDTEAHRTALSEKGRTIAVLGSGLDIIYPPENKKLALEIIKNGALVSGFPNGTKPYGKNFLARNKIIVTLSMAVLVIEGERRSGTISTASWAANEGVEVLAIAGSEATDWLIDQGATPVQNPQDVVEYLNTL